MKIWHSEVSAIPFPSLAVAGEGKGGRIGPANQATFLSEPMTANLDLASDRQTTRVGSGPSIHPSIQPSNHPSNHPQRYIELQHIRE
jgi:hypothetical protein